MGECSGMGQEHPNTLPLRYVVLRGSRPLGWGVAGPGLAGGAGWVGWAGRTDLDQPSTATGAIVRGRALHRAVTAITAECHAPYILHGIAAPVSVIPPHVARMLAAATTCPSGPPSCASFRRPHPS